MRRVARALGLALGLFVYVPSADAAITFGVAASCFDASTCTTSAVDTTGGKLLVCFQTWWSAGTQGTLSDSKGNTWVGLTERDTGQNNLRGWYVTSPTVGAGHTFTIGAAANQYGALSCQSFNSPGGMAFDLGDTSDATFGTSVQPGSITSAGLLVTGLGASSPWNGSLAIDASFTIPSGATQDHDVSGTFGLSSAYKISTGAENPTWSWMDAMPNVTSMGSFVEAASGGAPTLPLLGVG